VADKPKRASELEWLQYFYGAADFGPAHEDVVDIIQQSFKDETGLRLPEGYDYREEHEENSDD